ncbi:HAD family hydrolase [Streptomyces sp. MBT56]|uniref:HAD family hydrolase n=1 Tax=unclassified Streptomyces TaxID=2593676 RepID=UPI00190B2FC1|nr:MULTISPECIES: HAD family hydrolase [unclassified Streptomyces]MBK3558072.1 HAD family hydrolase [Streptomyces sp. MBT56]MBK3584603.1 HAD family hydrolase [Streptomyces sp. MBT57]MBK3605361.1 HAD family hydrolase [Streptomyces sp. MBT54]MBK3619370.1 HAD family hydrolase [Streptomyces sp. MBT98]
MESRAIADVLGATRAVLFDFDGPICDVFAGHPAAEVARHLAEVLAEYDGALGNKAHGTDDPMEVLRLAPQGGDAALRVVEDELTKAEVRAVRMAGLPIAGAVAALEAAHTPGRKVAIVSNNSAACVQAFLLLHGLQHLVDAVIGRAPYRPDAMKPDPDSLLRASSELDTPPGDCTLIGDSVTDVEAAKATGGRSVGFANKPGKERALGDAGADVVVTTMVAVAEALGSS